MKSKYLLLVLAPTLLFGSAVLAWPEKTEEESSGPRAETVALSDTPEAVRAAILRAAGKEKVTGIEKITVAGLVLFDVELEKGSIKLAPSGTVIEREREIDASALPAAIRDRIAKQFPGAVVDSAEEKSFFSFDVVIKVGDTKREIEMVASGHIDDDGDDDDDDDEDDSEDDE